MANTNPGTLFGNLGAAVAKPKANYLTVAEQQELASLQAIQAEKDKASGKKKVSLGDILTGVGTFAGALLGAKQQVQTNQQQYQQQYLQQPLEQKKDNTMWIVLGVLLVVVVGAIVVIKSKAK